MTIQRSDGPLVVIGLQAPLGKTTGLTGVAGPPPYVSGASENPDYGPSMFGHGVALRDPRVRSRPDGLGLTAGGYANQVFGFVSNGLLTLDFAPAAASATNLAAAHAISTNPYTFTLAGAAGDITVLASAFTVPGYGNVVPAGALQIGAAPAWQGYGASGAVQGWSAAAAGRGLVLTSNGSLSGISFTIKGYDLYGYPQSEVISGPSSGTTVNSKKCYKWVASIVASGGTSAQTASFGTLDVFEFPLLARRPFQTVLWWNNAPLSTLVVNTAGAAFTVGTAYNWQPPDTTSPATTSTGTVRGAISINTGAAADGTKRLQCVQSILPADLNTIVGMLGVTPL